MKNTKIDGMRELKKQYNKHAMLYTFINIIAIITILSNIFILDFEIFKNNNYNGISLLIRPCLYDTLKKFNFNNDIHIKNNTYIVLDTI